MPEILINIKSVKSYRENMEKTQSQLRAYRKETDSMLVSNQGERK